VAGCPVTDATPCAGPGSRRLTPRTVPDSKVLSNSFKYARGIFRMSREATNMLFQTKPKVFPEGIKLPMALSGVVLRPTERERLILTLG
jgi:hypothetical protein